jgi:NAD(P) transhydrogenase subunit alpha
VAATPDSTKKLVSLGLDVVIEKDAGELAHHPDEEFTAAGATIGGRDDTYSADIVLKVSCPTSDECGHLHSGSLLISMIDPFGDGPAVMEALAERKVNVMGMELLPRITRAQAMDVLSSQANLAGYKAAVEAAHYLNRLFPMMMTAAGSMPQSKAVVLGAGVAGLQAIATARRLGAQVEAFDVRPEVKEEIHSLGARFLKVELEESGAGEGGYAKELSKDSQQLLVEALEKQLPKFDIIISTAQIPGRPAPLLISENTVKAMKPGSVIVDLAAGSGGNCPLSEANEVVEKHGVTLVGHTNFPSQMAGAASLFYSRNLLNLLKTLVEKPEEGDPVLKLDLEDEIVDGLLAVYDGTVRYSKPGAKPAEKTETAETVGG